MTLAARFALEYPGFVLDVNVEMPGGGITALFGPSGSGKTTLLRCIAGLERAPGGSLKLNGDVWQEGDIFLPTHRRPLGYVFQEASLFPHLTVRGNLEYGRRRSARREGGVALEQAIELLGIRHLLDRMPERLSGGERQRVGIARALATSPRLLLMDEPLAALDADRKREILPYLEKLHEELEIPILYVSHDPAEVARLADYLVVLRSGRVAASGPLTETLARVDLPLRIGREEGVVLEAVVGGRDVQWRLARLDFAGGSIWVPDTHLPVGRRTRVHILARDVSLARQRPERTSILNLLPGTVETVAEGGHPAQVLVRVKVGANPILARVTRKSATLLELTPGAPVWVQVKSVALME